MCMRLGLWCDVVIRRPVLSSLLPRTPKRLPRSRGVLDPVAWLCLPSQSFTNFLPFPSLTLTTLTISSPISYFLQSLVHNFIPAASLKLHRRRQTGNLVIVLGISIGNNTVLARRDLLR